MPFSYVFYDIPDDNLRRKVSEALKDYGLQRLQKSVFCGYLTYNKAHELSLILDDLIGDEEADVRIIFVPNSFVDKVIIIREMYSIDAREVIIV